MVLGFRGVRVAFPDRSIHRLENSPLFGTHVRQLFPTSLVRRAFMVASTLVGRAARHRERAPARFYQSPLRGRRGGPLPLGGAAEPVSSHLHHLLRTRTLV